jgi:hypothetical protein
MSGIFRYPVSVCVAVTAGVLALTACGGSSGKDGTGTGNVAGNGTSAGDRTSAAVSSTARSTNGALCSRVDATTVNEIFGADPPFEARKANGLLPLPGAVTCTFHDGAARTVTISGVENAPEQYDAFLANANTSTAGVLKAIDGIGDKAAGGVMRDISAEVVFVHGDEFVVVVCVDAEKDAALFDKCKRMAAHMAA